MKSNVSHAVSSSAFASYASGDAPQVALCLSALKRWDPGLDIFIGLPQSHAK